MFAHVQHVQHVLSMFSACSGHICKAWTSWTCNWLQKWQIFFWSCFISAFHVEACSACSACFSMFTSCFNHVWPMFTKNKSLNIHWTYSNMLNMLNMAKHAKTCCRPLTPLFKKWGQGAAAWFFHVLQRSEHVSPCSVFFNVLNIEHVQIFFFHVQKTISCLLMFTHVQHVQHVLSLFRACSQGLNMLNMQLTAKMAIIFLIMFHFSISCWGMFSVFSTQN